MWDHPSLLYNTKVILQFVLNSTNRTYNTINTVADEFFNYAGYQIPYYDLGYRFLETFFQSIPDVLWVEPFSKQVYPSNWLIETRPYNMSGPAYCQTPVSCNVFRPHGLPWNDPGMINSSNINRTQWMQQRNHFNYSKKGNEFRQSSSIHSKQMHSSKVKISSPNIPDTSAKQTQKSITHETSIITSKKVATFAKYENSTPKIIHSLELDEVNVSNKHSGDHIDNGSGVDMNENEYETMPCFDLKQNDIVNAFPALEEKGLSDRTIADSDAPIINSSNSSESGPPPYSEMDMTNVAGATDNANNSLDISDSSDDEHKPNPNFKNLFNNVATPFIADDDPILMIGSKFWNKRYGRNIDTVNIESKMEVGRFYELYISEVNSPYKFWFQLIENDNCELYELERQLNMFYNTSLMNSEDLIDEIFMRKGYPCAALYCQQWHRAKFIGKPENKKVKLFFVDYGTVAKVSTSDIRYLLNTFCKLPRLCFRGTLDFIRPKYQRWKSEASAYFCDLIRDVKLVAGVSEVNTIYNSARIYLIDQSKNIVVNCKLVENCYAFPENPRDRCENHIADMLPTFESLENGEYPSLTEMDECLGQDFDAEKMFETKIIDGVDCYISQHISDEQAMETIQTFYQEKEMAKEIASKRDATAFFLFFERMLKNPFLNGMVFQVDEKENISSTNPFSNDLDNSATI